jgi:pyruvate,water dikinase
MPLWVNFSSVRYFTLLEILTKLVRRWLPDLREDAVTLLCSGAEGVLSTAMGHDIVKLAVEARRNEDVKELFLEHPPEKLLSELHFASAAKEFVAHLNRFLEKNGHRGLKELDLRSARWAEDPTPVLGMIRNYLLADTEQFDFEAKVRQNRQAIETEIQHKLEHYPFRKFRWWLIQYLAKQVRNFAKLRENSRFYHIMAFHFVRKKILRIEEELLQRGELKCKDDIFFLHMDEIAAIQAGKLNWFDVEDRLRERRIEHIRFSKMQPPKVIGMTLAEQQQDALEDGEGTVLRGQAASPGSYEGIARVILNPSVDLELQPGEILVAPYTDPAWTPLFLTAGAAVVEVGSYLSHAGTIAREYGKPCVVDVADCTTHIQTGDRLIVDGNRGIVRLSKQ